MNNLINSLIFLLVLMSSCSLETGQECNFTIQEKENVLFRGVDHLLSLNRDSIKQYFDQSSINLFDSLTATLDSEVVSKLGKPVFVIKSINNKSINFEWQKKEHILNYKCKGKQLRISINREDLISIYSQNEEYIETFTKRVFFNNSELLFAIKLLKSYDTPENDFKLGLLYLNNTSKIDSSLFWFEKAFLNGNYQSSTYIKKILLQKNNNNMDYVVKYFRKLYQENNSIEALKVLEDIFDPSSNVFFESQPSAKTNKTHINYLLKLDSLGDDQSTFRLGKIFYEGIEVSKDVDSSLYYFERACDNEFLTGCLELYYIQAKGNFESSEAKMKELIDIYGKDENIYFYLGKIYLEYKNDCCKEKAIEYFKKACKMGLPESFTVLQELGYTCFD